MEKIDNFDLKKKLGKGAFGTVWLAKNIQNNKLYAIKIYKDEMEEYKKQKIERSFKISKKIKHPNLMKSYNLFIDRIVKTEKNEILQKEDSTINLVLVMEYIKGKELNKIPDLNDKIENYLFQIVSALKYLHLNKIIHRDIKPENILVTEDGKIKIIDFDFLKIYNDKLVNKAGTPFYFSPEIWENKAYGYPTDLWSLGVTLYVSLTNRYPFYKDDKKSLKNLVLSDYEPDFTNISPKLTKIIKGLFVRDPEKRIDLNKILEYLKN